MLTFVLVEDDKKYQEKIRDIVRKTIFKYDIPYREENFEKMCPQLLKTINDDSHQKVYILDIELTNSISGIEIGKLIRKHDWESHIIYLTSHDFQFHKVFSSVLEVFAFIEKFDRTEELLVEAINKIANKKFDNKMLKISSKNAEISVFYKSITHIVKEKDSRKLTIYTSSNKFYSNMTLQSIMDLLDDRFKYTHRACIVNTQRIQQYNWTKGYFITDTGLKEYYISKKYRENFNESN